MSDINGISYQSSPKLAGIAGNVGLPPRRKVGGTPRGLNQSYGYNNINIILILEN